MIYTNYPEDPWFDKHDRYVTIGRYDEEPGDDDPDTGNALLAYTSDLRVTNAIKLSETETKFSVEELVNKHPEIFEDIGSR